MKKEYFLLLLAIIALSAYLFFQNKDQTGNLLPEIVKIDEAKIESIEIIKNNETINCFKDNDEWVVTQNKFPGNTGTFAEMIASINNLTITTLISEKENFKRYDLDKEKAIKVIAKGKDGILRKFSIGKTAPTQKHTFITLDDKKEIFHATGNLRRLFNKSVDNLRDKQIQKFDPTTIKSMELSKGDFKKTLNKKDLSENDLLKTLADLRCSSYVEAQTNADFENKIPLLKIILKSEQTAEQTYVLTLFPKTEHDKYIGLSSENKYVFLLEDYVADDIISNIDKLLNIKSESADEENS
ncbi:MAG: DUF4340 domain-containing protein [Desulfobacteraceae bacterium]|nr:DUF4340 domain-containing protein [Desulfobacteraceae bacterium]